MRKTDSSEPHEQCFRSARVILSTPYCKGCQRHLICNGENYSHFNKSKNSANLAANALRTSGTSHQTFLQASTELALQQQTFWLHGVVILNYLTRNAFVPEMSTVRLNESPQRCPRDTPLLGASLTSFGRVVSGVSVSLPHGAISATRLAEHLV